jgi:hypothetical protein
MIKLINKFPFIEIVRKKLTASDYHPAMTMNTHVAPNTNSYLYKACKTLLIENRVPIHKIRFVTEKSFIYDVDKNVINPSFKIITPINKKHPVIEVDKPLNTVTVCLGKNRAGDNYLLLRVLAKKSKRGVALLLDDNFDEMMWIANLDEAYDYYNEMLKNLDYNA